MRETLVRVVVLTASLGAVAGALAGCRTESSKDSNGEKVKIATPFGGLQMKVKTDENAAMMGTGLPVYPGATLVKEGSGKEKDSGAADINLSLGAMRLRIEVLSYQTSDATDKVRSFYAKELGRFGAVITCVDEHPVGTPTRTPEGLTCDKDSRNPVQETVTAGKDSNVEMKAGSPQHQHAVDVSKEGDGTKFALIRIDLPQRFSIGEDTPGTDAKQ